MIWIGTSAGINIFNGKDYVQFSHDIKDTTALPDDYINVLHRDKEGRMWVGTQNGLARYEGGYRFHRFPLPDNNENITCIMDAENAQKEIHSSGNSVIVSNGKNFFAVNDNETKRLTGSAYETYHKKAQEMIPLSLQAYHELYY